MPYDILGIWSTPFSPADEAAQPSSPDNYVQSASQQDYLDDDVKTAFDLAFIRDGRATATGNFKMGGFKITGMQDGALDDDAITLSQLNTTAEGLANVNLTNLTPAANASQTNIGVSRYATQEEANAGLRNDLMLSPATVTSLVSVQSAFNPGYIKDFIPTWVDADNLSITGGLCRDSDNTTNIITADTFVKDISQNWVQGDGGGVAQGVSFSPGDTAHLFVIAGGLVPETSGRFITDNIGGNLANFQAVSDGELTVRVDSGVLQQLINLDFTFTTTMDDVATIINNQISGCVVSNTAGVLTFTSDTSGSASSVELFNTISGAGTDIYDAPYLDGDNGVAVQGQPETAAAIDYGYDSDINATNLLADPNVSGLGFNKYRRIFSLVVNSLSQITQGIVYPISSGAYKYVYDVKIRDVAAQSITITAALHTLSVPVNFTANMRATLDSSSGLLIYGLLTSTAQTDSVPSITLYDFFGDINTNSNADVPTKFDMEVDSNRQIRSRFTHTTGLALLSIWTDGYTDWRL